MKPALSRVRRALLVADDEERLEPLRAACASCADEVAVVEVDDDATAVVLARAQLFDVVLAHAASRRVDLPALLGALAAEGGGEGRTPVLVVAEGRDPAALSGWLGAGAADVASPDPPELAARLAAALRRRDRRERAERELWELRRANERLSALAVTDDLTGLVNARRFRERLEEEFARADRYRTHLSLVMSDLDGFKLVNDVHGHPAGDRILAQIGQRLRAHARGTDIVARYGGDEFALLLPHAALADAVTFARRVRARLADAPLLLADGRHAGVGLSCGVASAMETPGVESAADLLEAADAALYEAKKSTGDGKVAAATRDARVRAACGAGVAAVRAREEGAS